MCTIQQSHHHKKPVTSILLPDPPNSPPRRFMVLKVLRDWPVRERLDLADRFNRKTPGAEFMSDAAALFNVGVDIACRLIE
jgi:hypothetical protein